VIFGGIDGDRQKMVELVCINSYSTEASAMYDLGVTRRSRSMRTVLLVFCSCFIRSGALAKTRIIFAPHPDDEALMASGIIYSALSKGDVVKVVVMTNGDAFPPATTATGITREAETVSGMSVLGLSEQNIIFLGYGDLTLMKLYNSASPTTVFTSTAGQTQTYASRGLGEHRLSQLFAWGTRSLQPGDAA